MPIEMIEQFDQGTQIKVIGVGGGGGNAVEHMVSEGVQGVEFICANTDAQALGRSGANSVIQLGGKGLGAGGKPEVGRAAAEEAVEEIRTKIDGANMLFITAGMGGGTGTGAAPVIARVAREMGILTVGVVTKPFEFEGTRRMKSADAGVAELEANVDSLIVVLNEKLLEVLGDDVTQDQAFAHANDVLKNAVGGISDIIHIPGLVNVDFEDVKTVMSEPGKAMMGTAIASGPDRATKAAEAAVACPLLEGIDLSGAKGVLVLIAAGRSTFKLSESRNAMNTIRRYAAEEAHVIYGTAYDESLGDQLRVTVIATGLSQSRRVQAPLTVIQTMPVQRTGTDNLPVMNAPLGNPVGAPLGAPVAMGSVGGLAGLAPAGLNAPMNPPTLGAAVPMAAPQGVATATPAMPAQQDYNSMSMPTVWRHRQHAAAKVEALSSHGMEEIEIPAFLRKQAD